MRVMLTSCGLETEAIKHSFLDMMGKNPETATALFIPTAAIDPGAIAVLPKCMNDLLKCGIPERNIRVFDLHTGMSIEELRAYDVVYLTGGRTAYLLERINDTGFRDTLLTYIRENGFVIGVSAGSLVFMQNLPDNLGLLPACMDVHCATGDQPGKLTGPLPERIRLSNTAALLVRGIPDDIELIDE